MTDILNTIRNARDGSMVDIRYDEDGKGAIASFPITEARQMAEDAELWRKHQMLETQRLKQLTQV